MDDVIACAAFDVIIARTTIDAVVAISAYEVVAELVAQQRIVSVRSLGAVDIDQRVGSAPAIGCGGGGQIDQNARRPGVILIGHGIAIVAVRAAIGDRAAVEHVVALPARKHVETFAPAQRIVACAAEQVVIAGPARQAVVAVSPPKSRHRRPHRSNYRRPRRHRRSRPHPCRSMCRHRRW